MKTQHIFLFILVSLLAFSLLHSPGTSDVLTWRKLVRDVETKGIAPAFKHNSEWGPPPPFSFVILFIVGKVSRLFQLSSFIGIKLSLAVFLLLTSFAFWKLTRNLFITTIMQLILIPNSMALGYTDIYCAPLLILSLWALKEKNLLLFTVLFSSACLIRWQPLIMAPFILIYILNVKGIKGWKQIDFKSLIKFVLLPSLLILASVLFIFGFDEFFHAFRVTSTHALLSALALNFNWVLTHLLHVFNPDTFGGLVGGHSPYIRFSSDLMPIVALSKCIFFISYTTAFILFFIRKKTFENLILYSLIGFLTYFMFNTGVHENHLFIPCILVAILFWIDRNYLSIFLTWSLIANINLFLFMGAYGAYASCNIGYLPFSRVFGVDLAFPLSIFNVVVFVMFFIAVIRKKGVYWVKERSNEQE